MGLAPARQAWVSRTVRVGWFHWRLRHRAVGLPKKPHGPPTALRPRGQSPWGQQGSSREEVENPSRGHHPHALTPDPSPGLSCLPPGSPCPGTHRAPASPAGTVDIVVKGQLSPWLNSGQPQACGPQPPPCVKQGSRTGQSPAGIQPCVCFFLPPLIQLTNIPEGPVNCTHLGLEEPTGTLSASRGMCALRPA